MYAKCVQAQLLRVENSCFLRDINHMVGTYDVWSSWHIWNKGVNIDDLFKMDMVNGI